MDRIYLVLRKVFSLRTEDWERLSGSLECGL